MSGFATDAPDSVCSNPELISGSADTTAVVVTLSDLQSFLSSDICQCTARHRCSYQVGCDAWSAVRRVRPGIIGPSTPPVLLPFQRNQHSRVATQAQHVLGSGRVRTYDAWQDASPSREDFSLSRHTQATYVKRVVESDDPSQDTECVKYRSRLEDEYKQDVLSGIVPYCEHDIVCGPYGYARVQLKAGALPKRQHPFPHIGERGEALGEIIRINLHKRGWLEELSSGNEWCFPPFSVPKPVPKESAHLDKWRMVIDFRYLNSQTQDDQAPLPLIEDMLERHERHKVFSVLDLTHGFHQMPLHPDDRHLTAMPTPLGVLCRRVLPLGVKNAAAQFQRLMEWILNHRPWPIVDGLWMGIHDPLPQATMYIDDQIIRSVDAKTHYQAVGQVLERLRAWKMMCGLNRNKLFVTRLWAGPQ